MISPGKAANPARRVETQAQVAVVPCGPNRGLAGIKVTGVSGAASGEYFVPFGVSADASAREHAYAGLTVAIDRLRALKVDRALIVIDDEELVEQLERRAETPAELSLQYIILGCKLNEFRRVKVVSSKSSRMEQLRAKTANLAATIYNAPLLASAI